MTWGRGIDGDGATPRLWRWGAEWIPAYAGMTVIGGMTVMGAAMGHGVGSRFRGNDVGAGDLWRRGCAPSWRWGADWVPAYAGMMVMGAFAPQWGRDSRLRGNDGHPVLALPNGGGIPASREGR